MERVRARRAAGGKARHVAGTVGLVLFAAVSLHVVNLARFDLTAFDQSARELVERSRALRDGARPEYEREVLESLPTNRRNGPVVHLADELERATVREMSTREAAGDESGVLAGWEFDLQEPGLVPARDLAKVEARDGVLRVKHHADDWLTNAEPLALPKERIADVVIRARADRGSELRLAWQGEGEGEPQSLWRNEVSAPLVGDDEFHTYVIPAANVLKRGFRAGEKITKILLVPSNEDGARVEIDFVRIVSRLGKYQRPQGAGYESAGAELRRVLYMRPDQTITWKVAVPPGSPRLDFGKAVLVDGAPVRFDVSVKSGQRTEPIHGDEVAEASEWSDTSLDLSTWAGRNVDLTLRVKARGDNVALWSDPTISTAPRQRFNVIVLVEDALRADRLSVYGCAEPNSPYRAGLAKNGVVFEHAFSQGTETRASVPALMTSLPPSATGVRGSSDVLDDGYLTMAEVLRAQGFRTAAFVQNGNAGPSAGVHQGFSDFFDRESVGEATEGVLGDGPVTEWLEKNRDRNFFVYLHILDPHGPYDPPAPFDEGWADVERRTDVEFSKSLDPPWLDRPTAEGRRWLYDREIRRNDSLLPGLFEKLDELGLRDETLVVLTSDHGEHLGETGHWEHGPPGRIQVLRVPLQFVYPARFRGERRIRPNVQLTDVMPTVLELAGVETEGMLLFGESLVDLVEGGRLQHWRDRITISEEPPFPCGSFFFRQWHVVDSNEWRPKLFFGPARPRPAPLRVRFYDFREDPAEARAARTFLPDVRLQLRVDEVMAEVQANHRDAWRKWTGGVDEARPHDPEVQALREIGYVN